MGGSSEVVLLFIRFSLYSFSIVGDGDGDGDGGDGGNNKE